METAIKNSRARGEQIRKGRDDLPDLKGRDDAPDDVRRYTFRRLRRRLLDSLDCCLIDDEERVVVDKGCRIEVCDGRWIFRFRFRCMGW